MKIQNARLFMIIIYRLHKKLKILLILDNFQKIKVVVLKQVLIQFKFLLNHFHQYFLRLNLIK